MKGTFSICLYIVCLLAFVSTSHAINCIQDATGWIIHEQGGLIALVLMFTALIIALAYMVGTFTGNPNFIVFAKDEMYHLGFSLVLLAIFGTALLFTCSATEMFYSATLKQLGTTQCYDEHASMSSVSLCYLNMMDAKTKGLAEMYLDKYIDELMASASTFSVSIPIMNSYTVTAKAYKRIYSAQYDLVLNTFIFPALVSINIQKLFLTLVAVEFVKWLLPLAFLMRVFIPTRQMGNMLIALGVGLHVLVPFIYVFNLAMYDVLAQDCERYADVINDAVFEGCGKPISFWEVAAIMPQGFFIPNLTIALLITFLVAINKALRVIG
ncbi:MAG: hypothetical protein QW590_02455 [Candidatus Bilamarchaeaceae archaeon]